jgi:hypothetical protein
MCEKEEDKKTIECINIKKEADCSKCLFRDICADGQEDTLEEIIRLNGG